MEIFKIEEGALRGNQFSEKFTPPEPDISPPSPLPSLSLHALREEGICRETIDETCMFAFVTRALTRHTAKLDIKH